ncbi:MAG: gluconate 2-dehydrogenase subunit 3 family protein [Bacteroidota bacterium]|nr:gluconate 2-dehydrogenase subunit 3 family protein [Bacteroidota bacterium]MDE2834601.1 gluconate 2-dehydrogenase subunit 3 family protein [Bacteroidota bacterium]MDE2957712.1 gluconate 2-dehydrogenase subunit 3 family protein [Bacteroidota bacterium]
MIDRREALQRIGWMLGGTLSASTIAGVLGGCSAPPEGVAFAARTLTDGRDELVAVLAELIIPETDTPGARAARVHEFADAMLTDWYEAEETARFLEGLRQVQRRAEAAGGAPFNELTEALQVELLTQMEEEAHQWQEAGRQGDEPFFFTIKSFTLFGYYTSEIGATQELRVNPMGEYNGDVPYEEIGRSWA